MFLMKIISKFLYKIKPMFEFDALDYSLEINKKENNIPFSNNNKWMVQSQVNERKATKQ